MALLSGVATCDGTMNTQPADLLIPVTLQDGTRIRLRADEIAYVEPVGRGALIHRDSGEPLMVVHDARTVELRVIVALAGRADTQEYPAGETSEPEDPIRREADRASIAPPPERESLNRRAKRLLRARVSLPSLMIGGARRRPGDKL
ncbi:MULTISPECIES: hypothetical protein [Sphingobium]|uniref:hypothetical protein n=1 Tax=Sphingobium TaxID=165695 RepID=UPI00214AB4FD|nr:hypothetical protein [Sphingobium sp. CFD-2]